jgi:hypothetical protein
MVKKKKKKKIKHEDPNNNNDKSYVCSPSAAGSGTLPPLDLLRQRLFGGGVHRSMVFHREF